MTGSLWPAVLRVAVATAMLAAAFTTAFTTAPAPALAETLTEASLGPVTRLPLPRYVSMRAETANARRGPGLDHRIDWEFVHRGQPLRVVAEYGQWRRVVDRDGAGGWVHHSLLSGARTVLVTGQAPAVLRAGAGENTAVRAMAEPGVVARLDACRDDWCAVRAGGFRGWVPRDRLWGVDPGETLD
jgi:SH3-like domain-containing protein